MEIKNCLVDKECTVSVIGRLDSATAPQLEREIESVISGIELLIFDFSELEYLSSAGLRVLLASYKKMKSQNGNMKILSVNSTVNEIFVMTGMINIFDIE